MRGRSLGWASWAPGEDALDVGLRHLLTDLPMHDGTAGSVEDRAQVVERATEVEVRDVNVPVLVRANRLDESGALLRRLLVPAVEQAGSDEHAVDARGAGSDDVPIDHHKRQPTIAFERELVVKADDGALLVVEQPVVARDEHQSEGAAEGGERVVLVRLAVALLPLEEFAACNTDPGDEAIGGDLGLRGPGAHEVDDLVAYVMGDPATRQGQLRRSRRTLPAGRPPPMAVMQPSP